MTLTPEHIAAIFASIGVLVAAIAYYIRSSADARKKDADTKYVEAQTRQKDAEATALRERAEVDTDAKVIDTITGTIKEERSERIRLRTDYDKLKEERDTYHINWQNSQTLLEASHDTTTRLTEENKELKRKNENLQAKLDYCRDQYPDMNHLLGLEDKDT